MEASGNRASGKGDVGRAIPEFLVAARRPGNNLTLSGSTSEFNGGLRYSIAPVRSLLMLRKVALAGHERTHLRNWELAAAVLARLAVQV